MSIVVEANRILPVGLQLLPHPRPPVTEAGHDNTSGRRSADEDREDAVEQEVLEGWLGQIKGLCTKENTSPIFPHVQKSELEPEDARVNVVVTRVDARVA